MSYTLQKHLQYNQWANGKIAEIIRNTDENIFDKEVQSSFPSLMKTVLHIWDGQEIWWNRIHGTSLSAWPSTDFMGKKNDCLNLLEESSKKYVDFIDAKDRAYLEKTISFKTMSGDQASETVEEILFHVVNHGTFHRGQLVTMLRIMGITTLSATDLIRYLRLK